MARLSPSKLSKYRSMRDFAQTAEPSGAAARARDGHSFVIQAHAARRMHYDFRLELDGVLLSWSVPKGPSLSPTQRRLAVRTEDHPLDYAGFEGIIPAGQYGGGTVVVWDRGRWEPDGDARAAMAKGRLTFQLHGEKLHGRWHLVKTRNEGKAENWLLFKGRDDAANDQLDIVTAEPASVLTGRTIDEVAAAPDRVWHSNRAEKVSPPATATTEDQPTAEPASHARATRRAGKTVATRHPAKPASHARNRAGGPAAKTPGHARAVAPMPLPAAHDGPASLVEQLPLGFKLTNLDRVLYPEATPATARATARHARHPGITKGDLIAYLAVVSDWMLPHVARRPLTIVRCPEGLAAIAPRRGGMKGQGKGKACFFQKHILPGAPPAIERVAVDETDGDTAAYMQVHDMPGVVALAQLGTLEIHTWGSHADRIERPDLLVLDLDPDEALAWDTVALAALELRGRLRALGLDSFVKTTGGKGLHVVVPITRGPSWDEAKAFTKAVVEAMEREAPDRFTSNMAKARRKGRIFVDYLRNGRGATFIAPYSPRARPGAPVATPITWDELAAGVDPAAFTTTTVPRRLAQLAADPWHGIDELEQSITAHAWRAVGGEPPRSPEGGKS